MGFRLIPKRDRSDIILEGLVSAVRPPSQSLYIDAEITPEAHWIHDVPAVEAPFPGTISLLPFERIARIGGRVDLGEAVTAAEIILRAGATYRWELAVAIEVKLNFSLSEPTIR
jgi:hypothetical protein